LKHGSERLETKEIVANGGSGESTVTLREGSWGRREPAQKEVQKKGQVKKICSQHDKKSEFLR